MEENKLAQDNDNTYQALIHTQYMFQETFIVGLVLHMGLNNIKDLMKINVDEFRRGRLQVFNLSEEENKL